MVPAQSSNRNLTQSGRRDLAVALDRVAAVLIGIYIILFIDTIIPPHINDPRWLTGILDSLRAVAFLPLLSGALILLANQMDRRSTIISKHRNWVRKFAPLVALGFFLLIPLQGLANYKLIREVRKQDGQKIAKLTRAMATIRYAQDETGLRSGINEVGIQNLPQGKLNMPLEKVKEQIIAQIAPEILKIQHQSGRQYNKALQTFILQWLSDSAIALLYGFGFRGLS
jgi:hypothetical protein